jgi:hypothetical protein
MARTVFLFTISYVNGAQLQRVYPGDIGGFGGGDKPRRSP